MPEDTIPTYIFDYVLEQHQEQIQKLLKQLEDSQEAMKHERVQSSATWMHILYKLAEILNHPRGGIPVALQAIEDQIKLLKQFDQERE